MKSVLCHQYVVLLLRLIQLFDQIPVVFLHIMQTDPRVSQLKPTSGDFLGITRLRRRGLRRSYRRRIRLEPRCGIASAIIRRVRASAIIRRVRASTKISRVRASAKIRRASTLTCSWLSLRSWSEWRLSTSRRLDRFATRRLRRRRRPRRWFRCRFLCFLSGRFAFHDHFLLVIR